MKRKRSKILVVSLLQPYRQCPLSISLHPSALNILPFFPNSKTLQCFANDCSMSSVPSLSETTSPIALVRSSEHLDYRNHVSPTSTAGATAITPSQRQSISHSLTETLVERDKSLVDDGHWYSDCQHHAGSNEGTPRLLPVSNGSFDLPSITGGNSDSLEFPKLPPTQTLSPSISSISNLTSSLPCSSKSSPSSSQSTFISTPYFRTKSYGSLIRTSMAEDENKNLGSGARAEVSGAVESSTSARAEAFSEDNRNRSTSRSGKGRVEKRIEASMVEAEPATNARSRKSSHMMQLFKKNTTSFEPKKPSEKPKKTLRSTSDGSISHKSGSVREQSDSESISGHGAGQAILDDDGISDSHRRSLEGSQLEGGIAAKIDRSRSQEENLPFPATTSGGTKASDTTDAGTSRPVTSPTAKVSERRSDVSRTTLPSRVLEEIRTHHNLVAPVNELFKTSQQKRAAKKGDTESTSTGREANVGSVSAVDAATDESHPDTEDDLDEDSSDKELISSALYFPHHVPSPDALESLTLEQGIGATDSDHIIQIPKTGPVSPVTDSNETSEDIDIALESQRTNRYLHGALPKENAAADDPAFLKNIDSGTSSASESEYSSLTDDGQTTPRATTSAGNFLRARERKGRRPRTVPLQAVELKPFKHQVGGHSTIFRFSKKAVCKQLSNKENEFYEIVEQAHPELLSFLPK